MTDFFFSCSRKGLVRAKVLVAALPGDVHRFVDRGFGLRHELRKDQGK